jgi:putative CocE/NonD family hydrolase
MTTSTGKRLSVRVSLPAETKGHPAPGPFPVLLVQAAYNTNLMSLGFVGLPGQFILGVSDPFLVKRGYAMVAVDALGTGASEGGWELLGAEEQQGFAEAVDWVDQQPWSNGKIGVGGISYMGISALYAAQQRPDKIDAVFASVPMGDAMRGTVGIGGLLNAVFMAEWMSLTHNLATQNFFTALTNPRHMTQLIRTTREHVAQIEKYHLPMINHALDNDPRYNYDGEFWRTRSPIENMHKVKAPTVIIGALHDIFQRDPGLIYEILRNNGVDARLIIHDGTHVANFMTQHVGNQRVPPIDFMMLQWFDKHLKGIDSGTEKIAPVTQFVKHFPTAETPADRRFGSFVVADAWPHPDARAQRWYLHGDGSLTLDPPRTT